MKSYMLFRLDAQDKKLDQILSLLQMLGVKMSTQLDALTVQVAASLTVEQSAIALIQGLATQIAANANDPAAITALSNQLNQSAAALSAAIVANTPVAPSPVPPA